LLLKDGELSSSVPSSTLYSVGGVGIGQVTGSCGIGFETEGIFGYFTDARVLYEKPVTFVKQK
jgi:hypothetical protein